MILPAAITALRLPKCRNKGTDQRWACYGPAVRGREGAGITARKTMILRIHASESPLSVRRHMVPPLHLGLTGRSAAGAALMIRAVLTANATGPIGRMANPLRIACYGDMLPS